MIENRTYSISGNPTELMVMHPILGGHLGNEAKPGDHAYRAEWLARESGNVVLAVEGLHHAAEARKKVHLLGLPKALDPSEFTTLAAQHATELQARIEGIHETYPSVQTIRFIGASAGAGLQLALLHSELLTPPDSLVSFDPVMMGKNYQPPWPLPQAASFVRWADHQSREVRRPANTRNQHPSAQLASRDVGPLAEMALMSRVWPGNTSYRALQRLAQAELAGHMTTQLILPSMSFNHTHEEAEQRVTELNAMAEYASNGNFAAAVAYNTYHSATDDPAVFARISMHTPLERGEYPQVY